MAGKGLEVPANRVTYYRSRNFPSGVFGWLFVIRISLDHRRDAIESTLTKITHRSPSHLTPNRRNGTSRHQRTSVIA